MELLLDGFFFFFSKLNSKNLFSEFVVHVFVWWAKVTHTYNLGRLTNEYVYLPYMYRSKKKNYPRIKWRKTNSWWSFYIFFRLSCLFFCALYLCKCFHAQQCDIYLVFSFMKTKIKISVEKICLLFHLFRSLFCCLSCENDCKCEWINHELCRRQKMWNRKI